MTGQPRSLNAILTDRLQATQEIAAANTGQLRLSQKASGMMVLDMKDERDGVDDASRDDERAQTHAALERNMEHIHRLEARLSALDDELEASARKERE